MYHNISEGLLKSWATDKGTVHSNEDILEWIELQNQNFYVNIERCLLSECKPWYMDPAANIVRNVDGTFFSVEGLKTEKNGKTLSSDPVINQPEIGYLGIIVCEINGIYHFLMQAKIEPGNVNRIQISPTIQATRSNFLRAHHGLEPPYLDYFRNTERHIILADQLQSEQSSRFYRKRNRNMVILVRDEVPELPTHRFMTLGQIKTLMRMDNLINMDTRTVLSSLPFTDALPDASKYFLSPTMAESVLCKPDSNGIRHAWNMLNDVKMYDNRKRTLVGLDKLSGWTVSDEGISPQFSADYEVIYCRIEIEGREVRKWSQPLFKAHGEAIFGLMMRDIDGKRKFLCHIRKEVGCFDVAEWGPTIQHEAHMRNNPQMDSVEALFYEQLNKNRGILTNVVLSEEGGRFYHEQNRNVLMISDTDFGDSLPPEYIWLDYAQLARMLENPYILNIQLRNLLSLIVR